MQPTACHNVLQISHFRINFHLQLTQRSLVTENCTSCLRWCTSKNSKRHMRACAEDTVCITSVVGALQLLDLSEAPRHIPVRTSISFTSNSYVLPNADEGARCRNLAPVFISFSGLSHGILTILGGFLWTLPCLHSFSFSSSSLMLGYSSRTGTYTSNNSSAKHDAVT